MAFNSKFTGAQVDELLTKVQEGNLKVWKPTVSASGQISWQLTDSTGVPSSVSIVGPTGPAGNPGNDGAVGPTGPAGAVGPTGPAGLNDWNTLVSLLKTHQIYLSDGKIQCPNGFFQEAGE